MCIRRKDANELSTRVSAKLQLGDPPAQGNLSAGLSAYYELSCLARDPGVRSLIQPKMEQGVNDATEASTGQPKHT
jgi:hypothetical protein